MCDRKQNLVDCRREEIKCDDVKFKSCNLVLYDGPSAHEGGPLLSYSHSLVLLHCGLHTDCVAPSDALTSLPSSYKYL